jgi:hypothetical protein
MRFTILEYARAGEADHVVECSRQKSGIAVRDRGEKRQRSLEGVSGRSQDERRLIEERST